MKRFPEVIYVAHYDHSTEEAISLNACLTEKEAIETDRQEQPVDVAEYRLVRARKLSFVIKEQYETMETIHAEVLDLIKRHGSLDRNQLSSGLASLGLHGDLSPREAADYTGEIASSMVREGLIEMRDGRWFPIGGK